MKVISLINLKGGVGKTSSTVNIATVFALMGFSVLILDTDKQSNSTQYLGRYDEEMKSMYHVFTGQCSLKEIIRETDINGLHIAPATIELVRVRDKHLEGAYNALSGQIDTLGYDYVFIDCPPDLNPIVDNALAASTDVLVPIKIDNWALLGFGYLMERIQEIRQEFNPQLRFAGAFITMDKARTNVSKEAKKHLMEHLGNELFKTCVRDNSTLVTSTFYEKPVVIYDKSSNSAKDYYTLSNEIFQKIKV
jgi:chromosome partitioning protein